jgi:hypothetical protein
VVLVIDGVAIRHTQRIGTFLMRNPVFQNWETRLEIMGYELQDAIKMYKVYAKAFPTKSIGYEQEGKLALASVLIQLEMFCVQRNINFDELRNLGYERLMAKCSEVHDSGGKMI